MGVRSPCFRGLLESEGRAAGGATGDGTIQIVESGTACDMMQVGCKGTLGSVEIGGEGGK